MQLRGAWSAFGFSILLGCGGTFTQESGGSGVGGSGGTGLSIETGGHGGTVVQGGTGSSIETGGHGGSVVQGGTSSGGNMSYGASGGDLGGYGNYGGDGASGGNVAYGGQAGQAGGCGPATSPAGPYPVKFVFSSNTPVYIKEDCRLNYDLYSCNSGMSAIGRDASCIADCSDTSIGCIACGACFSGAALVGPGSPVEDTWAGKIYKYGTLPSGCACASGANAAPGVYTLVVSEFFSEADAMANTNGYQRQLQFELPAPSGTVQVDLGFIGI